MGSKKIENPAQCSLVASMNVLGGKWKILVLYHLSRRQPIRFGELLRRVPDITQAVLATQLRELEADGIVARTVYAEVPPRVEYRLTELGNQLQPVFGALWDWGRQLQHRHREVA